MWGKAVKHFVGGHEPRLQSITKCRPDHTFSRANGRAPFLFRPFFFGRAKKKGLPFLSLLA
jgi:hypothetical protein